MGTDVSSSGGGGSVGANIYIDGTLLTVSALAAMELGEVREKALSYQTVLRYLEPRAEMRLLWRSALDIGTGYIETISNTIRRKGCAYERMTSVGCDLNTRSVTITERIMMTSNNNNNVMSSEHKTSGQADTDLDPEQEN